MTLDEDGARALARRMREAHIMRIDEMPRIELYLDQVLALVQGQLSGAGTTYAQVLAAQPVGKTYTQWTANPGVAS